MDDRPSFVIILQQVNTIVLQRFEDFNSKTERMQVQMTKTLSLPVTKGRRLVESSSVSLRDA